jgi:hypothetical protein
MNELFVNGEQFGFLGLPVVFGFYGKPSVGTAGIV